MPQNNENFNNTGQPVGGTDDGVHFRIFKTAADGSLVTTGGGSGSNAAAGPTGIAVPGQADYVGINIAGNLIGLTGVSLTNAKAAAVAIVDGNGTQITSFGGGTQFADNGASGAAPVGTLSMGWDSVNAVVRALRVDTSQNLKVAVQGTVTVGGSVSVSNFPATQPVSIAATVATDPIDRAGRLLGHVTVDNASIVVTNAGTFAVQAALNAETTKVIGTVNIAAGQTIAVTNTGTFVVQATLAAETTKVIGTVNQGTSPWVTSFSAPQHVIIDSATLGTVSVSGTVTANQGGAPWSEDVTDRAARLLGHVTVDNASLTVVGTGTFAVQATLNPETTKVIGTVNIASGQTIGISAGSAVIGHVIADSGSTTVVTGNVTVIQPTAADLNATVVGTGTFVVQATLAAETTKVIGTVNIAAAQTIGVTGSVSVSNFPATQPVSGTVTANQGTASALSKWSVSIDSPINQQTGFVNAAEPYGSPLIEVMNTILYELRGIRLATVANTCDGGRYKESDFDPGVLINESEFVN